MNIIAGQILRTELKHLISEATGKVVRTRLACLLRPDANSGTDGRYLVRSLYFDTPEDRALREKEDGVSVREKYRLRLYNLDFSFIRLEKKIKYYAKTEKHSVPISREDVQAALEGNTQCLHNSCHGLAREFAAKLRTERLLPKVIVDYWREAFFYPFGNVRVTIDSDVRGSVGTADLFDPGLVTAPALEPGMCILEVKYDQFVPEFIQDIIQLNNCTSAPASKYASCRMYG